MNHLSRWSTKSDGLVHPETQGNRNASWTGKNGLRNEPISKDPRQPELTKYVVFTDGDVTKGPR